MGMRTGWNVLAAFALLAAAVAVQAAEVEVTLEEPGDEPRRELRYAPEVGETQRTEMTMEMSMTMQMQGVQAPSQSIPKITYLFETTVDRVEGDVIHYSGRYIEVSVADEPGVNPQMKQMMEQELAQFEGAEFTAETTTRGVLRSAKFNLPQASPNTQQMIQSLERSFDQMSAPLPEEPVGVGAEWVVNSAPTFDGISFQQSTTNRLQSLDNDTASIDSTFELTAGEQNVEAPGLPPNVTVRLIDARATGEGELELVLTSMTPTSSSITTDLNMEMEIRMPQGQQQVKQQVQTTVEIRDVED